jgi:hypothetical protein
VGFSVAGRQARLDDPHDFVRLEIAGALERNIRVLPVLVDGTSLPSTEDLPADVQALTRRQAVELRDSRWDDDIERLVEALTKFVEAGVASHQPPLAPAEGPVQPAAVRARSRGSAATARARAIAAVAVLVVVGALAIAWGGRLGSRNRTAPSLEPPQQTAGEPARPQPAVTPAADDPAADDPAAPDGGGVSRLSETASEAAPDAGPASPRPRLASAGAKVGSMPDVRGKPILEARETLRRAGFRFVIRLFENRSREPGIVQTQTLDAAAAAAQPPRVILTAVASSTVLVHVNKGNEQSAEPLVEYLKSQPSAVGTLVRAVSVVPRAEMAGRVGYSESRLAPQAEAVARDVSEYLARAGSDRRMTAVLRPAVAARTIIVALYEPTP